MPNKTPPCGIVIPTYNCPHLPRAVQSVMNQNYPDVRLVIVNDGGTIENTDPSWEQGILNLPNNQGPSAARNLGIQTLINAGCEYIGFLDADDEYKPDKVSKSVELFEKYQSDEMGLVYTDYDEHWPEHNLTLRSYKMPFDKVLLDNANIIGCNSILRAEALKRVGGFDTNLRFAEDWDLWLRLVQNNYLLIHLPESLWTYHHSESDSLTSVKNSDFQKEEMKKFLTKWRNVSES